MPLKTEVFKAPNIKLGDFSLSHAFLHQIDYSRFNLNADIYPMLAENQRSKFKLRGSYLYKGNHVNPQIGDIRVSYFAVYPGTYSIVGKQQEKVLRAYKTETGAIGLIMPGHVHYKDMFQVAMQVNNTKTWTYRIFLL